MWGNVGDQLHLLNDCGGVEILLDVTLDLEVVPDAGRCFETLGKVNAVQGKLAQVVIAIDAADQVTNGVAGNQAGWVDLQLLQFCFASA